MYPILQYAQATYSPKFFRSKYFQKQPTILTDVSFRTQKEYIPFVLIIKDADRFPTIIKTLKIKISSQDEEENIDIDLDKHVSSPYFAFRYKINVTSFTKDQKLYIDSEIHYLMHNKTYICKQDNYIGIEKSPLTCYYSSMPQPHLKDWRVGDIHTHSIYTNDQVEFGADLETIAFMAEAIGLHFVCITDHSYDLDDALNSYKKNDPNLPKWKKIKVDIAKKYNVEMILGEEVSVGNSKQQNIHLLTLGNRDFIAGSGDSGDKFILAKPTVSLSDFKNIDAMKIASHPFQKNSLGEKFLLNRGTWTQQDIIDNNIDYLEILNGEMDADFYKSIELWKALLLDKHKIKIVAGNDAHGNFSIERNVKTPLFSLETKRKHLFGRCTTGILSKKENIIEALKENRIIISNGPFLNLVCELNGHTYNIDDTISAGMISITILYGTTKECGRDFDIRIFYGNYNTKTEIDITEKRKDFFVPYDGYIRAEMKTNKHYFAYTNPIWFKA